MLNCLHTYVVHYRQCPPVMCVSRRICSIQNTYTNDLTRLFLDLLDQYIMPHIVDMMHFVMKVKFHMSGW